MVHGKVLCDVYTMEFPNYCPGERLYSLTNELVVSKRPGHNEGQ